MEEEGSTLKLVVEKGPREGETLEYRPGSVVRIGRVVRGNTLAIKDAGISSKHLSIESKSGKWVITDLDSSNGTVLNGSQLQPMSSSDLRDGDVVKIGEYTSIKVQIEVHGGDNQLRRNTRRRSGKEGEPDCVGGVAENRTRRGGSKLNLASIGEDSALELGNGVELVAENQGRRRGRPRKLVVAKSEPQECLCEVEKVEKLVNVDPIEPKRGQQLITRRTRSSKNKENSSQNGNGCQELEASAQIVDKITRGGSRRKKNLQDEPMETVQNEVLEEKEAVEEADLGQEESRTAEENLLNEQQPEAVGVDVLEDKEVLEKNLQDEPMETVQNEVLEKKEAVEESDLGQEESKTAEENLLNEQPEAVGGVVLEDKEVLERSNLGHEGCEGLAVGVSNKESGVDYGDGPDLEKMTLGEWFRYLEVYLPKQIYDQTEAMILQMNQRAEQFHEFILKQKSDKDKSKLPMG